MATAETITYRVEIGGAAEAAVAFDKLSTSANKTGGAFATVDTAATKTSASLSKVDAETKKINEGASKGAKAIGMFATAASGLDGSLGKVASTAMMTAQSITSFGAYLGGPWGVAIAAAVSSIGLLTTAYVENKKAAQEARDAAFEEFQERERFREKEDERLGITKEKLAKQLADQEAILRVQQGVGSSEDIDVYAAAYNDRTGGLGTAGRSISTSNISESESGNGAKANDDSAFAAVEREDAYRKQLAHLNELDAQYATQKRERELAAASDRDQMRLDELDRQQEAYWADYDAEREVMDARAEMQEEYARKYAEREKLKKVVAIDAAQSATTAGISALQKLATGQKVTTREVIASIGEQMVARGTGHILEGTAMAIMGNPQGGALIGVGSAEVATGLGLGAASKGGGGGGGSGSSAGGSQTRAASPTSGTTFSSTHDERPIIINYNAPTVVSPTEDDARRVKQVQDEGRRFGV